MTTDHILNALNSYQRFQLAKFGNILDMQDTHHNIDDELENGFAKRETEDLKTGERLELELIEICK